jgi:hypothetical protein
MGRRLATLLLSLAALPAFSCGAAAMKGAGAPCSRDADCGKGAICFFGQCALDHAPLQVQVEVRPPTSSGLPTQQYPAVDLEQLAGQKNFVVEPRRLLGTLVDDRGGGTPALPGRIEAVSESISIPGHPLRIRGDTDGSGVFSFLAPPEPGWAVRAAFSDGVRPLTVSGAMLDTDFKIHGGSPLYQLGGKVGDGSGAPVTCLEATVVACPLGDVCRGKEAALSGSTTVSDPAGGYSIAFDAGWISAPASLFLRLSPPQPGISVCVPVPGPTVYAPLPNLTGTSGSRDVVYGHYLPPVPVVLQVKANGGPVANADVLLEGTKLDGAPAGSELFFAIAARTDAGGLLAQTTVALAGTWSVVASPPLGQALSYVRKDVPVKPGMSSVSFDCPAQPTLTGVVIRPEDGLALADVVVSAERADDGIAPAVPGRSYQATTDASGRFNLQVHPSPKGYRLFFDPPAKLKLPRWSVSVTEVTQNDVALTAPVQIPFAQALTGSVSGGPPQTPFAPLPDARVDVYWIEPGDPLANPPRPPESVLIATGVAASGGNYEIYVPKASTGVGGPR